MEARFVYRVLRAREWHEMQRTRVFVGGALDARDGYVHLSTCSQVPETIARYFADDAGVVVVEIDAETLGEQLRWERSRGGVLFPHLYAHLAMTSVVRVMDAGMFTPHVKDDARRH